MTFGVLLVMMVAGCGMAYRVRFQSLAGVLNPITGRRASLSWLYAAVPVGAVLGLVGLVARTADQLDTSIYRHFFAGLRVRKGRA